MHDLYFCYFFIYAFVALDSVVDTFEIVLNRNIISKEAQKRVYYFEDTWIGRPARRNACRPPQFPHNLWNYYDTVLQGLPKTNNSEEAWHRSFESQVACHHTNIWKFLKKEQKFNEILIQQYFAGAEPNIQKKKYRDSTKRLHRLVSNFEANDISEYLRGIT